MDIDKKSHASLYGFLIKYVKNIANVSYSM